MPSNDIYIISCNDICIISIQQNSEVKDYKSNTFCVDITFKLINILLLR